MTDHLDQPLLYELAKVASRPGLARVIASNAGFPEQQIPSFEEPLSFWDTVIHGARSGAMNDGVKALARAAGRHFPRNKVFLAYSTEDEVITWRIRISIDRATAADKDNIVQLLQSITGDTTIEFVKSYVGSLVLVLQTRRRTSVYLEWLFANGELDALVNGQQRYPVVAVGEIDAAVAAAATIATIPPRTRLEFGLEAALAGALVLMVLLLVPAQNSNLSEENEETGDYNASSMTGFDPAPLDVPPMTTSTGGTSDANDNDDSTTAGPRKSPKSRCLLSSERLKMHVTHEQGSHYATVDIEPKRPGLKYVVRVQVKGRRFSVPVPGGQGSVELGNADSIGTFTLTGAVSGEKCLFSNSEPYEITISPKWSCRPDPLTEEYTVDSPVGRKQCQRHMESNPGLINRSGDSFIIPDAERPTRCVCHRS